VSFLSPLVIAIAGALTIPPLIALYFLKLKRVVKPVPSTLLWKKAVEDLRVNAPFQRLRGSLLLLLQLLVLILAAVALGKPMFEQASRQEETVLILIDQSASMGVIEADGRTRLDIAKEQAKKCVDNLDEHSRAMVIELCDRASVVSSFDTDKHTIKRKIDSIEQTQSTTTLGEAARLAEAYAQQVIIADTEPRKEAGPPPATVYLFTDGRIGDADRVALQRFKADELIVTKVGERDDNVGILSLDARRNYDRPEQIAVSATLRNFGSKPQSCDAVLYIEGDLVDVQTVQLAPGRSADDAQEPRPGDLPPGSVAVCAFDEIEFDGQGVIEVALRIDDALKADNRGWTIIEAPRHISVLLVTPGNPFLAKVLMLESMPLSTTIMSPSEYESASNEELLDGDRSKYDVVLFDGHSTDRLPQGNYLFWGAIPKIEGVSAGEVVDDEVIFNWDDTHPILRYVATENIEVWEWVRLRLPSDAVSIIEGQTSPVLSYFSRDASQYLLCAFRLIIEDEQGRLLRNTWWFAEADFVVFMQNVTQFLASNVETTGERSLAPGEPATLPIPEGVKAVKIHRPDNSTENVPAAGYQNVHYGGTRLVGVYRVEPGVPGHTLFAVNLFDRVESDVLPVDTLRIGAESVGTHSSEVEINRPAWIYFLLAMLLVLAAEWVVYNLRVFV
jgi:hypothetical protein